MRHPPASPTNTATGRLLKPATTKSYSTTTNTTNTPHTCFTHSLLSALDTYILSLLILLNYSRCRPRPNPKPTSSSSCFSRWPSPSLLPLLLFLRLQATCLHLVLARPYYHPEDYLCLPDGPHSCPYLASADVRAAHLLRHVNHCHCATLLPNLITLHLIPMHLMALLHCHVPRALAMVRAAPFCFP